MTTCASERQLVELATGDGDAATRAHAAACAACAARLAALEGDLSLLRAALAGAPASARTRRGFWVPAVATATMAAALLLFTLPATRPAGPVGGAGGEPTADLGEALASALFADPALAGAEADSDASDLAVALGGGALCDGDDCDAEVLPANF